MADYNSEGEGLARLEANEPAYEHRAVAIGTAISLLKGMSSYAFGLVLLLFVVFLWTTSSFLGSSIFADGTYAKPFFLTYLNTSTFILAAAPDFIGAAWRNRKSKEWKAQVGWIRERYHRGGWRLVFTDAKDDEKEGEQEGMPEGENLLSNHYGYDYDQDDEQAIRISNSAAFSAGAASASTSTSTAAPPPPPPPPPKYATRLPTSQRRHLALLPTLKLAFQFCPLWFASNYLASACLQHTSVASTTILTSTSSIWTLALGVLSRTERFTVAKFLSVVVSLFGIFLISRADLSTSVPGPEENDGAGGVSVTERTLSPFPTKPPREIILGDAMALGSALMYGYYTIFLKKISTAALPLKINMSLLFGLIGLINAIVLAPLLLLFSVLNIEVFQLPPTSRIWAIVLVNSTASLVADLCWAHALVLTSPLVVTVGLSLTIPVSLVGEMFLQGRFESAIYWLGSLFVVASFVFVAREEARDSVPSSSPSSSSSASSASLSPPPSQIGDHTVPPPPPHSSSPPPPPSRRRFSRSIINDLYRG